MAHNIDDKLLQKLLQDIRKELADNTRLRSRPRAAKIRSRTFPLF